VKAELPRPILVVDEDPVTRAFVRAALEADGLRVVEAATGAEVMRSVGAERPCLVLLDLMLPKMDGFSVLQALRRLPPPFIPILLVTSLDDPSTRERGIAAGADEILPKPIRPFELRLRVRAMLRIEQLTADLHAANCRLQLLARTDELTRVRNRRGLYAALEREFRRAERYRRALTVLAFDVDHFKRVNDAYGHAAGDRVLRAVAQALEDALRRVDVVGRTGGEEFVVVAPETPPRDAERLAERLRRAVAAQVIDGPGGELLHVTVSCGVATLGQVEARSAEELLGLADEALYQAKRLGRDRCVLAASPAASRDASS
jgi:diguanylate cyclase (GGDEF)-like protein